MTLVTGATGFIGSHLIRKLTALGEHVRCLVRRSADLPPGAEAVRGDLATGEGIEPALRDVDGIVHLAGVTKALRNSDYYTGNVQATEMLARAVEARPVRFVHVSSLAAAGPSPDGVPLREDSEPHPVTHYGKSKLLGEQAVRRMLPDAVIVRPPVVYGPRDTDVFQLLRSISKGWVMEIAGGERWFSAIYVEDLVDGLIAALRSPLAAGQTYFLANPKPSCWSEFSAAAARIMHRSPRVVRIAPGMARAAGYCAERWSRLTGKPGILSREKVAEAECRYWTCDPGRAANDFGFAARTPLEEGLSRTLAWYKEAGWLTY